MSLADLPRTVDAASAQPYTSRNRQTSLAAPSSVRAIAPSDPSGSADTLEMAQPTVTTPLTVLLAEPDRQTAQDCSVRLALHNIRVITTLDGADALLQVGRHRPDVVLLNSALPVVEGWVVKIVHQDLSTPVIVGLKADSRHEDGFLALEAGAVAVVPHHPYRLHELVPILHAARLRPGLAGSSAVLAVGPLTLDSDGYRVTHRGKPIDLSPRAFQILALLMSQPDRTFTYLEIRRRVWGTNPTTGSNTLSVHVKHVRDKLDDHADHHPRLIQTVRGIGYRLVTSQGQA